MSSLADLQLEVAALQRQRVEDAENTDAFFSVSMALFVLLMQFGFAIRECGVVRVKNATRVLLRTFTCTSLSALIYWLVGYAFAYGEGNFFLGYQYFAAADMPDSRLPHWVFNFALATLTPQIVAGALAERCRLVAHIITTVLVTGFVQPCVCHWAWSPEGWLRLGLNVTNLEDIDNSTTVAFQDFGGSGVVHLLSGSMALIGCVLLGSRIGRFTECGRPNGTPVHSTPLTAVGSFLVIVGTLALTAGRLESLSHPGAGSALGLVTVNMVVAGALSGLVTAIAGGALACRRDTRTYQWSVLSLGNGVLVGMVSMSAGADNVYPWSAAVIGIIGGLAYLFWTWAFLKAKIDDPLHVISVHVGGGLWGLIAAPLFRRQDGIVFTSSTEAFTSLGWNLAGALAILAWSVLFSAFFYGLLLPFRLIRVDRETEKRGLDESRHGEPAYSFSTHNWEPAYEDFVSRKRHHHHHRHHVKMPVYKPSHSTSYPRGMYGSGPPLRY